MTASGIKNNDLFGLQKGDLACIISALEKETVVEEAILFGSRAKGNHKNGSDVDIAVKGIGITPATITGISFTLNEETLMPYRFDILNYHTISNISLIAHIERVGITVYRKVEHF